MIDKCIICEKNFKINNKRQYSKHKTCSSLCYYKTNIPRLKFLKTFLNNKNIKYLETDNLEILEKKYAILMSEITKKSTEKKHKTIKEKYGDLTLAYKNAGTKSSITARKRFLIKHNIIDNDSKLSDNDLHVLYKTYFNKLSNHGDKIAKGRFNKYKTKDKYIESYKLGTLKTVCNFYNLNIEEIKNEEQITSLIKQYFKDIKFFNNNPIKWKITHLKNIGINNIENFLPEEINKLYSEYISNRFNSKSLQVLNNGYKKSKKGWYVFKNTNLSYFYRSSWELIVLKALDILIKNNEVLSIKEPNRVLYYFDNRNRYYYPDIEYLLKDKRQIVLEIKPTSKLNDPINIAKMTEASKTNLNFKILSENEIFSKDLLNILLFKDNI